MKVHIDIDTTGRAFTARHGGPAIEVAWVLKTLATAMERRGVVTNGPLCDSNEVPCGTVVYTAD